MSSLSPTVELTLIDVATGEVFAVSEMPPADLPESFELDTTLHLGEEDWTVVDAQPRSRREFAQSRKLTLRLRRVEYMPPDNILFSLPSICDGIPALSEEPLSGNEFVLAEDDWRQIEFASNSLSHDVDAEINQIRLIHENAAAGSGWREIHVRSKPEIPLRCDLKLHDLADTIAAPSESIGVTYHGAQTRIADGFAFQAIDVTVYGLAPNGCVQVIAFDQYSNSTPTSGSFDRLRSLADQWQLDLVDWCRCQRVGPDSPDFSTLLTKIA